MCRPRCVVRRKYWHISAFSDFFLHEIALKIMEYLIYLYIYIYATCNMQHLQYFLLDEEISEIYFHVHTHINMPCYDKGRQNISRGYIKVLSQNEVTCLSFALTADESICIHRFTFLVFFFLLALYIRVPPIHDGCTNT